MGDLTAFFSAHEFKCSCGCGQMNVKGRLLLVLDNIRVRLGKPVHIESGCRCKKKNASLPGSSPNSGHLTGEAADIYVDGMTNKELGAFIKDLHAKGLLPMLTYCYLISGTSNTRVHVGVDVKKRNSIFVF